MKPDLLSPFEISVVSGKFAAREATRQFIANLSPLNLDDEETGTVELILAEVLNNIVEHAYPPNPPAGPISICCEHVARGLLVEIRDKGRKMPGGQLPAGVLSALDVELENMPEGGFGWFLIQHLARDVSYRHEAGENLLRMRLAIGLRE